MSSQENYALGPELTRERFRHSGKGTALSSVLCQFPAMHWPHWGEWRKTLQVKKSNSKIFKGQENSKFFSETVLNSESYFIFFKKPTHGAFADKVKTLLIVVDKYQDRRIHKLMYVASSLWSHFYKYPSCQSWLSFWILCCAEYIEPFFFKPLL